MPSELQRVAQELLDALSQIERIVPYLHERAQKYREAAVWVGNTSNNPSARIAALQLDEAARRCTEAADFLLQARQPGIQWVHQLVSGIRTTEPSRGPTGERPLGQSGKAPPPGHRQRDDHEEKPEDGKPDNATDTDHETNPGGGTPQPRLSDDDARRLFGTLPVRERSGLSRPKTRGKWIDHNGVEEDLASGEHDEYFEKVKEFLKENNLGPTKGEIMSPTHVETKFAMRMRLNGLKHETIVVNKFPCEGKWGCETLLGYILPPGATLTVFGPAGFKRTYPLQTDKRTEQP
jgi:hypothetical protein